MQQIISNRGETQIGLRAARKRQSQRSNMSARNPSQQLLAVRRGAIISSVLRYGVSSSNLRVLCWSGRVHFGEKSHSFATVGNRVAKDADCFFMAGSGQFMDRFGGARAYPYTLHKWTVVARLAEARVVFVSIGPGPIESLRSRLMVGAALFRALCVVPRCRFVAIDRVVRVSKTLARVARASAKPTVRPSPI